MKRSRLAALVGLALVASSGAVVLGASPAFAAPAVTVSPNTGLTNGQSVTISGTGFSAGASVAALECKFPPAGASSCDLGTLKNPFATADMSGNITGTYTVKQNITVGGSAFDCASSPTACTIVVAKLDQSETALGSIAFKTGPAITVTPSTGLTTGTSVTVSGTGFGASVPSLAILLCKNPPASANCDTSTLQTGVASDATGKFTATYTKVKNPITVGGSPFDCSSAASACSIVVANVANPADTANAAAAPVSFASSAPTPPTVTASVSSVKLGSGGAVTVNLSVTCTSGASLSGTVIARQGKPKATYQGFGGVSGACTGAAQAIAVTIPAGQSTGTAKKGAGQVFVGLLATNSVGAGSATVSQKVTIS